MCSVIPEFVAKKIGIRAWNDIQPPLYLILCIPDRLACDPGSMTRLTNDDGKRTKARNQSGMNAFECLKIIRGRGAKKIVPFSLVKENTGHGPIDRFGVRGLIAKRGEQFALREPIGYGRAAFGDVGDAERFELPGPFDEMADTRPDASLAAARAGNGINKLRQVTVEMDLSPFAGHFRSQVIFRI